MKKLINRRDDDWGILELQNCILNVAEYIDQFCEQKGIDYCLMGGSALGAIRHNGFIPWDDDLDIFMRPDEYKKFRREFLRAGDKERFYLQEWGATNGEPTMAKLRYNYSHYVEQDFEKLDINKGVFVDIFILHSCPENKIKHWWQYIWSRYLVIKSLANRNYIRRGRLASLILKPLKWLPKRAFVRFALKQIYRNSEEKTKYYCHYLGRAGYHKGLYKSEYFKSTKRVKFENISLRVPDQVEKYLYERWGDYMKLPTIEEIRHYQHSTDWCIDRAFDGYNPSGEYKDEDNLIA